MRRSLPIFILSTVLLSAFALFVPRASAAASEVCWQAAFIYTNGTATPGTVTVTLNDTGPTTHTYSKTFTLGPGVTQTVTIYGVFPATASSFSSSATSLTLTFVGFGTFAQVAMSNCRPPVPEIPHFDDGRINAFDIGAPVAAYCADEGITVWDINDNSQGSLAFSVSLDEIHAALNQAQASGHNVLIGEGLGDSLYALTSNEIALIGPDLHEPAKQYQFIAAGDRCG